MNEKLGPCPFCNGTRITATAWYADTRLPGAAEPKTSQADFCPKCGRPLTEEAVNAANESLTLGFDVIDTQTGEYPKIREISRKEEWAERLIFCWMESFAISEDGNLIMIDDRGNYVRTPAGRFRIIFPAATEANEALTPEPCPFCGGSAELEDWKVAYENGTTIRCVRCGACISESGETGKGWHNRAVRKWNRRPPKGGGGDGL